MKRTRGVHSAESTWGNTARGSLRMSMRAALSQVHCSAALWEGHARVKYEESGWLVEEQNVNAPETGCI